MDTTLRPSGIDGLGDMSWGTHFCLFYETKEDLLDTLVPYFKAGLEHNEFCVWVVADPLTEEDAWRALGQAVPAFERYRSNQSIELLRARNWYLNNGHFELDSVISAWNRKLTQALARGYAGMRVSGDTLWLEKKTWQSFLEYENQLDESITDHLMAVLCTYQLTSSDAAEILDVARKHQFALVRRGGALEVLETSELKQAKAEITRLNADLERRVEERTVQLAATNEELRQEISERKHAEEALRASEARLQAAIDAADVGLWDWDLVSGKIIWLGHHEKLFGFAQGEFDGTYATFENRIHPEDLHELNSVVQRARDEGSEYIYEYRVIWPDGSIHWIAGRGRFIYNEMGQAARMYGAVLDITERKRVVDTLRRSESNFRTLVDKSLQGIVIGQGTKIMYANPAHSAIYGYTIEELKSMSLEQLMALVHPIDRAIADERARKRLAGEELSPSVELRIVRKDGSTRWIQLFNNPIEYDGQPALLSVSMDITERKRAEEALRKSEQVLREAESLGHTGSWEQNLVTGEIFNTEENLRLFFGDDHSKGTDFEDYAEVVHPDDREYVMQRRLQLLTERGPSDIEYRVVWPDGSVHVIFGRATVVYDELGQAIRVYGTNVDITERKQAEESLRRSESNFRTLVDKSLQGIAIFQDQKIIYANPAQSALLGYTIKELKSMSAEQLIALVHPPLDRDTTEERVRKRMAGEELSQFIELRILRKDGSSRWIQSFNNLIEYNEQPAILTASIDITERKQAESTIRSLLQISEKLTATLDIDVLLDSLVIEAMKLIDAEIGWSGLRTEEGMVCHTHIGQDLQVVPFEYLWPPGVGLPGWVLIHKVPYVMNDAQADKFLIPEIREQFGVKAAIDAPILDAQGEVIGFFEVNNKKNGAGFSESDVEKLVAVSRIASIALQNAISYRNLERVEKALRESEDQLRLIIDTIPIMAWTVRPDGIIDYLNQRWMDYTGLSLEQYVEEPTGPIHPKDNPGIQEKWLAATAAGEPYEAEMRLRGADGEYRWFLVRTDPLRDESGKIVKWYGVSTDIDDRKRAEEEMNRQAARAETLARIAARLNKQLDLDAVIHAVCQEVIDTFKVSQATMSLYDKRPDLLVYAGGINIPPKYAAIMEPITRSQFDEFLQEMGPIMVVRDIQSLPDVPNAEFSSHLDVRTVVTAAMLRDRELIGVLVIGVNGHVREFDQDELTLLKAISDQAAQAVANALLLKAANEQREQLRALSSKLVEAQETERRALTTELHDRVGQNLTGLSINLQNMKALLSRERAQTLAAKFDDAQALVQDTTRHIRDVMAELRLSELEDYGLAVALETYAERAASRGNLKLISDLPDLPPPALPSYVRIALFRAAQEAISNVLKHADATILRVGLYGPNGKVLLRIEDNGQGFEPESASQKDAQTWGLKIMRERIESIGGNVQIESEPGKGTRVIFEIKRPS